MAGKLIVIDPSLIAHGHYPIRQLCTVYNLNPDPHLEFVRCFVSL